MFITDEIFLITVASHQASLHSLLGHTKPIAGFNLQDDGKSRQKHCIRNPRRNSSVYRNLRPIDENGMVYMIG
jgi:hypothetical protein